MVPVKSLSPDLVRTRIVEGQEVRVGDGRFIGEATVLTLCW